MIPGYHDHDKFAQTHRQNLLHEARVYDSWQGDHRGIHHLGAYDAAQVQKAVGR